MLFFVNIFLVDLEYLCDIETSGSVMFWKTLKEWLIWATIQKFSLIFEENLSPLRKPISYPPELLENRQPLGAACERIARFYLEREFGLRCIGQNVKLHFFEGHGRIVGEIDLIMEDEAQTLIFVEVRSRSKLWARYTTPVESVTHAKRLQVCKTARLWLRRNQIPLSRPVRFDIVSVIWLDGELPDVQYYPDAFTWERPRIRFIH